MSLTNGDLEQIRIMLRQELRQELAPIKVRLDAVEEAIIILANQGPGTTTGQKSHVARQVEDVLSA